MVEIISVPFGKSAISEKLCFVNGNKNKYRKIAFKIHLIKTDDKLILVDAGCETMPGFVMENFIGTVEALKNINITPDMITDILITHSHHDHIECVKYFKNAVIHIEKDEFQNGKNYIPEGFKVNMFENELCLCDEVKIVKSGGHSKGSCVVEVNDNERFCVIIGDECYLRECITKKIPTGSSVNRKASEDFIKKYSDEKYTILLSHDE